MSYTDSHFSPETHPLSLAKLIMLKDSILESFCYDESMNKNQFDPESKKIVIGLLLWVFGIEALNLILSLISGSAQADTCPKSDIPGWLSIFLSIVAFSLIITIPFVARNKILGVATSVIGSVFVIALGLLLWFYAGGGLDWCAFLGR